jgi:hypothetical protein
MLVFFSPIHNSIRIVKLQRNIDSNFNKDSLDHKTPNDNVINLDEDVERRVSHPQSFPGPFSPIILPEPTIRECSNSLEIFRQESSYMESRFIPATTDDAAYHSLLDSSVITSLNNSHVQVSQSYSQPTVYSRGASAGSSNSTYHIRKKRHAVGVSGGPIRSAHQLSPSQRANGSSPSPRPSPSLAMFETSLFPEYSVEGRKLYGNSADSPRRRSIGTSNVKPLNDSMGTASDIDVLNTSFSQTSPFSEVQFVLYALAELPILKKKDEIITECIRNEASFSGGFDQIVSMRH